MEDRWTCILFGAVMPNVDDNQRKVFRRLARMRVVNRMGMGNPEEGIREAQMLEAHVAEHAQQYGLSTH